MSIYGIRIISSKWSLITTLPTYPTSHHWPFHCALSLLYNPTSLFFGFASDPTVMLVVALALLKEVGKKDEGGGGEKKKRKEKKIENVDSI